MSARNVLQSPSLFKQASFVKDKMHAKIGASLGLRKSSSGPVGREQYLLNKDDLPVLIENVKTLILHLRARIEIERANAVAEKLSESEIAARTRLFESPGEEAPNPAKILSDARTIKTVTETGLKNLQTALCKFTIHSIAAVMKLIFQSAESPLIKAEICAEIFTLQENANKNKLPVDIDDLRAVLGKAPARNIDILGQLIALLSTEANGSRRLAYMWGIHIFFPRFDVKSQATKEYDGFDVYRQTTMINSVTQMMIEQCGDVFGLEDDDFIKRLAQEIREIQTLEMKAAAIEFNRAKSQPPAIQATPIVTQGIRKPAVPPKVQKQQPIGKCEVQYEFIAEGKLEISVAEGEQLFILEKGTDEWWKVRTMDDREGLVPETYVEEIEWDGIIEEEDFGLVPEQPEEAEEKEYEDAENNARMVQQFQLPRPQQQIVSPPEEQYEEQYQEEQYQEAEPEPEPELEPVADEIEDEITLLQKKISELQRLKSIKKPSEGEESPAGNPVRKSAIGMKAFDENPTPSPVKPSMVKMAPPPLPFKKQEAPPIHQAQLRSVSAAAAAASPPPRENQKNSANPPSLPVRAANTAAVSQNRVGTPFKLPSAAIGESPQQQLRPPVPFKVKTSDSPAQPPKQEQLRVGIPLKPVPTKPVASPAAKPIGKQAASSSDEPRPQMDLSALMAMRAAKLNGNAN